MKTFAPLTKTQYGLYVELGQVYMLYNDVFYFTQAGYIPVGGIYLDPKALVVVDEEEPAAPLKARLFIGLPDDEVTAISASLNDKGQMINDKWYDLNGRRLNGKPTAKGVYINNGKKYVVK